MLERAGTAAELHGDLPFDGRRVYVLQVERPVLVLGSTTKAPTSTPSAGIEVVRRRSGGGAVLLDPADLWLDLFLPRADPLWLEDVGAAAHWVGEVFAAAIGGDAHVHRGPMVRTEWSSLVCFAGIGPGEVTTGEGGPKLVGISQRRTRAGARFQCVAPRRWDAVGIASILDVPVDAIAGAAAGSPTLTADAVIAHLP